ncbi:MULTISPECIES: hypothetical protein [unclassified Rhizobium]|uniref:hypothetical protein n=1 Tax=unclassified Rhizobium TaxID=2613769 RepID=UPI00167EC485|nr:MULTISPECIES: hypothetical protein [unclassified Rhizobium]
MTITQPLIFGAAPRLAFLEERRSSVPPILWRAAFHDRQQMTPLIAGPLETKYNLK